MIHYCRKKDVILKYFIEIQDWYVLLHRISVNHRIFFLICAIKFIAGPPFSIINALAELGYRVICSTGEAEILWTLQREL